MTTTEKRAQLEAAGEPWPECDCHDEPLLWQKDPRCTGGGRFFCRVNSRARRNRWRDAQRNAGLCISCKQPTDGRSRCDAHAEAHDDHLATPWQRLASRSAQQRYEAKRRAAEGFEPTGAGRTAFAVWTKQHLPGR